jgi:dihydroorotate dehydrogenase
MYKKIISPFLFLFDPESVHNFTFIVLKLSFKFPLTKYIVSFFLSLEDPKLEKQLFGLNFKNPVGVAAGLDKNAAHIREFSSFGFGFVEVGTITPEPQIGNPKKRLFRLEKDNAIINRMGFNNEGLEKILTRLKNNYDVIIGGNIGKNKSTPNAEAKLDYLKCFKKLYDYVDYFVINISSPNTPRLRELQTPNFLRDLFKDVNIERANRKIYKPILIKISPDLEKNKIDELLQIIKHCKIDGIVATNTTVNFPKLVSKSKNESGGLSGAPLQNKSNQIISYISKKTDGKLPIIGVGGILSAKDAINKLRCGAHLVQLYTGIIYEGPVIAKKIKKQILKEI